MARMIRFYRDVLGFEIKEAEDTRNVYLVKDGTLFLLYGRKDFEKMTNHHLIISKGYMVILKLRSMLIPLKMLMPHLNVQWKMVPYQY